MTTTRSPSKGQRPRRRDGGPLTAERRTELAAQALRDGDILSPFHPHRPKLSKTERKRRVQRLIRLGEQLEKLMAQDKRVNRLVTRQLDHAVVLPRHRALLGLPPLSRWGRFWRRLLPRSRRAPTRPRC